MKNINWTVRIKNVDFWITVIPVTLILLEKFASLFGFKLDLGDLGNQLLDIVRQVFLLMAILGIVNDPTTAGLNDSQRAMDYTAPHKDAEF